MLVYRIQKAKFAIDISGFGSTLVSGGWHQAGNNPILYTSSNISLAILECLVHLPSVVKPPAMVLLTLHVPDSAIVKIKTDISAVRATNSGLFYTEGSDFLTFVTGAHVTQMTANSTELFFWYDERDGFYFRASDGNYENAYIVTWVFGGRQHIDYAIINETLFFA